MTAKICPKCGCVYADGRSECTDCGEYTRPATNGEVWEFASGNVKKLRSASGTRPQKWQYISAAVLIAYSAALIALYAMLGLGFPWISVFNFVCAAALVIPVYDKLAMLLDAVKRRRFKVQLTYNYTRLRIGLVIAIIINLLYISVWLFMENGILIRMMT